MVFELYLSVFNYLLLILAWFSSPVFSWLNVDPLEILKLHPFKLIRSLARYKIHSEIAITVYQSVLNRNLQ